MDKSYWLNETIGFLSLASIRGVGFWTMHSIADSGYSFKEILKSSSRNDLCKILKINLSNEEDWEGYKKKLWDEGQLLARELAHHGVMLVFPQQEAFPEKLKNINDPPRWIFIQGKVGNLFSRSVAIVGSRKPSQDGVFLTKYIVSLISNSELVSVSGLAMGIDRLVHEESLRYGVPTVAVLGNGFKVDYPKGSYDLRSDIIASGGTVISEYLPFQTGSSETFVRRNRLQAALSETVVPVEWKIKSGTAHTVSYAYNYKKSIVNLYLPKSYEQREELQFSERKYNAWSFEVPFHGSDILSFMKGESVPEKVQAKQMDLGLGD